MPRALVHASVVHYTAPVEVAPATCRQVRPIRIQFASLDVVPLPAGVPGRPASPLGRTFFEGPEAAFPSLEAGFESGFRGGPL